MSETETRDPLVSRWRVAAQALVDDLAAARAESDRLRGVVEAVQALADEWECRPEIQVTRGSSAERLRAALAPVSSSGEAESGEAAEPVGDRWDGTPLYSCPSCRRLTVNEPPRSCAGCEASTPAPVPSGGQES